MASRHVALANSFPINFPDPAIITLYAQPIVSSIDDIRRLDLTCTLPDITAIVNQCELRFEWGTRQGILQRFERDIVPAMLMHVFLEVGSAQSWPSPRSEVRISLFLCIELAEQAL